MSTHGNRSPNTLRRMTKDGHLDVVPDDIASKAIARHRRVANRAATVRRCNAVAARVNRWLGRGRTIRDLAAKAGADYRRVWGGWSAITRTNGGTTCRPWLLDVLEKADWLDEDHA